MRNARRGRGEVPALVLAHIASAGVGARLTPYRISRDLRLSAGSVTQACKALVGADQVHLYGTRPYMVGAKAA